MFEPLKTIERKRIQDKRNIEEGVFLNRAERVKKFTEIELQKIFDFNRFSNIGNYYDVYKKYSDYIQINQDEMLITNGAEEAIRYIFNIFLKENDKIMFPIPTYGMYHVYSKIYNVEKIMLEYNNFKINKELLYDNLNTIKVFFLPNPSHIEDIFEESEIINILSILKKNNGLLVIDETYFGYGTKTMKHLIHFHENVYIIRSFSKTFGLPSIRLGCLISNKKNMDIISNYRPAYEVSYPSLKIGEYFLDNIDFVNDYIQECIKGREYLLKELKHNNIAYNGKSNYLLNINIEDEDMCNKICDNLEEKYIYVRNCKKYISITIGPIIYMKKFFNNFVELYDKYKNMN